MHIYELEGLLSGQVYRCPSALSRGLQLVQRGVLYRRRAGGQGTAGSPEDIALQRRFFLTSWSWLSKVLLLLPLSLGDRQCYLVAALQVSRS